MRTSYGTRDRDEKNGMSGSSLSGVSCQGCVPLLLGSSYAAMPFGPGAVSSSSTSIGFASSPLSLSSAALLPLVFGGISGRQAVSRRRAILVPYTRVFGTSRLPLLPMTDIREAERLENLHSRHDKYSQPGSAARFDACESLRERTACFDDFCTDLAHSSF